MARLHFDENTNYDIAVALIALGHDVVTSRDVGLDGHDDDEQLLVAAAAGRILVTHNRKDFVLLHRAWRRWSRAWGVTMAHAGILLVPQDKGVPPDLAAREIDSIQSRVSLANELFSFDRHRHRWGPDPPS